MVSQPRRKKKSPTEPHLSASPSPLSVLLAARRTHTSPPPPPNLVPRAGHPRVPCHPFTLSSPLPLCTPDLPRSPPQTLTLSTIAAAAELRPRRRFTGSGERRRDSSLGELPCAVILRFWPSPGPLSLPAGPATSASVRRRLAPSCRSSAAAPRPRCRW